MRAFLLIALLAMAATVSCEDFNASPACKNATETLYNNANVTAAVSNNRKGGCTEIDYEACTYAEATGVWTCTCATTYANKTSVDAVITGAGGQSCYLDLRIEFAGNQTYNNATRPVTLIASQTGLAYLALSTVCNTTDKSQAWQTFLDAAAEPFTNSYTLKVGNATWTSATIIVSGCEAERRVTKTFTASGTTTNPPTTPSGTTTTPPTVPPSSTGKSGASIIASSFALVASLIAAVTILA